MCIIFYNEVGKPYDTEEISVSYDNNPHGVGLMWVEKGKVRTIRGLFSKEKLFNILAHFKGVPHALHLRWATRGGITKNLCHPFRASYDGAPKSVYMMHNGTFFGVRTPEGSSDTEAFAQKMKGITKEFGTEMLFHESFLRRVEKQIESYNKVIFFRDDGKVAIMNPEEWTVKNGIWYSNVYSLEDGYRKAQRAKEAWNRWVNKPPKSSKEVSSAQSTPGAQPAMIPIGGSDWLAKSRAWEEARAAKKESQDKKAARTGGHEERSMLAKKRLEEMGRAGKDRDGGNKEMPEPNKGINHRRVIRRRHNPDGGYIETVIRSN